jgi:DNA/RNA endonuclease G (NUC1)
MANMSAQWGSLNQQLWANLEAQVLFWGVNHGPIHVVTGPVWSRFPSNRFDAIKKGRVSTASFPKPGEFLKKTGGAKLPVAIARPTGFYKVAFRPGRGGEPDRAIAFLVPHTKQRGISFWEFVSTVSLVEETSGLRFGFADELKDQQDLGFWRAQDRTAPAKWNPRIACKERLPVAGWMADRTIQDRVAVCNSTQGN